jgi:hypothetical protein
MHPPTQLRFAPHHNASVLIQNDRLALAHQLQLCRTARSGWRRLSASTEGVQAFVSQHLISLLMLIFLVVSTVFWLIE